MRCRYGGAIDSRSTWKGVEKPSHPGPGNLRGLSNNPSGLVATVDEVERLLAPSPGGCGRSLRGVCPVTHVSLVEAQTWWCCELLASGLGWPASGLDMGYSRPT